MGSFRVAAPAEGVAPLHDVSVRLEDQEVPAIRLLGHHEEGQRLGAPRFAKSLDEERAGRQAPVWAQDGVSAGGLVDQDLALQVSGQMRRGGPRPDLAKAG